ncbi:hypothetical protein NQ317_009606 [Molorchus minor]|uniref:Major facilitator superfamily (MFS) profile domain-containing protein n=1 Tax=Molorchus minor TaxID=1323400 RepID=A0ABQ9IV15_9CUCU|nr:hypothetical protein NQ317_009606 [Molorchus minor]
MDMPASNLLEDTWALDMEEKKMFGLGIAATSFFTIISPWSASTNVYFFMTLRLLQGIGEGISTPCIYEIWSKWAPPLERSRLLAITFGGMFLGTVIGMPLSGALVVTFGWSSVFYSFGIFGLVWYVMWLLIVADTPQNDPRISYKELRYITGSLRTRTIENKKVEIPWKHILTSVPIWAILMAHFCENWGYYTLLTQLPAFMKRKYVLLCVLNFDLNNSGLLSALPYLVLSLMLQICAQLADWLLEKRKTHYYTSTENVYLHRIYDSDGIYAGCSILANTHRHHSLFYIGCWTWGVFMGFFCVVVFLNNNT